MAAIETKALLLKGFCSQLSFFATRIAQRRIRPTGKAVLLYPFGFTMAYQDEAGHLRSVLIQELGIIQKLGLSI